MINDIYHQADKVILATDASISNIRLNIPNKIIRSINKIKPIESLKIITIHKNNFSNFGVIQTQSILTNIVPLDKNILSISYIYGSKTDLLYTLLSDKSSKKQTTKILSKLINNITGITLPPVIGYIYCKQTYGYHINKKIIETNFWHKYGLILAGEWVHPYHNTIEGSCLSSIDTFHIITSQLYIDKLRHKPDNVKSIEENRRDDPNIDKSISIYDKIAAWIN
jgi:hypothetical protein